MSTFVIALEGLDYAGKTSVAADLAARFSQTGRTVASLRAPGGTPVGKKLRELVVSMDPPFQDGYARQQVFLADHRELLTQELLPAVATGAVVILDRWLDSTRAYAVGGLKLEPGQLERMIEASIYSVPEATLLPDITLYFDLSVEMLVYRRGMAGSRNPLDTMGRAFYHRTRQKYLSLLTDRHIRLDAHLPLTVVADQAWNVLQQIEGGH